MKKKDIEVAQRFNQDAKMRRCLGHWCGNKEFFSTDASNRYCAKCDSRKNQIASSESGIKILAVSDD
jgi:Zn finger protein HypA/HybF involved in hydrogenase expression